MGYTRSYVSLHRHRIACKRTEKYLHFSSHCNGRGSAKKMENGHENSSNVRYTWKLYRLAALSGACVGAECGCLYFLGDYLGEFPYPQRTLEILYELKQNASCIFIRGNKEDYWLNRRKDQNCDWKSGNRSVMAMIYNYNSLNAKDLDFLKRCRSAKASGLPGWNRFWLVMERLLRIRKRCFQRIYSFKMRRALYHMRTYPYAGIRF